MSTNCKIRLARPQDAEELLEIFRPYVLETAVAFNYEPPTLEEFRDTMEDRLRRYPYLVAETEEGLMGYAYASPFKARAAYDWAVETSIYVKQGHPGQGYGRLLHDRLEELLKSDITYGDFFRNAPALNPARKQIKGSVCGVKVETIEDPLMQEIRYLDKLVDELAKGKQMEKIMR